MQASETSPSPGIGHNKASVSEILRDTQAELIAEVDALAVEANAARDALVKDVPEGGEILLRSDAERDAFVDLAVRAAKLGKKVGETRLSTTKPLREEVEETNKFFNTIQLRPDRIKAAFEPLIDAYDKQQRLAANLAAARAADEAKALAEQKLAAAAAQQQSVVGDVIMNEAVEADEKARKLAEQATTAGSGPTRTETGVTISATKNWTHTVEDWSKIDLRELRDSFTPDEIEKAIRKHVKAHKNTKPLSGVRIYQDEKSVLRG